MKNTIINEHNTISHLKELISSAILWPLEKFKAINRYIYYRWAVKTHALTSTLKRGMGHELDDRMLYALFDELVEFVEVEHAWMHVIVSENDNEKYKIPWYHRVIRFVKWRCAEAGVAHLEWSASLIYDDEYTSKDNPKYGLPTEQAIAARQILELYHWWKVERSSRPDVFQESGYDEYIDIQWPIKLSGIDREKYNQVSTALYELENKYYEEDTEMLIKLMKIRSHLWT